MRKWYYAVIALCALMASLWATPVLAQMEIECTNNEAWLPVPGATGPALSGVTLNNELYVLHRPAPNSNAMRISRWNGSSWTMVSEIEGLGYARLMVHDNALYMYGGFSSVNGVPNTQSIAKWNGTAWEGLPGADLGWVMSAASYNNALYVAATFTIGGTTGSGIAKWDGTAWSIAAQGGDDPHDSLFVQNMVEWNGALYLAGSFSKLAGVDVNGVGKFDGTTWSGVGDPGMQYIRTLTVSDNQLYITDGSTVKRLDGTTWEALPPTTDGQSYLYGFGTFDGDLYAWGAVYNGRISRNTLFHWDGTAWTKVSGFNSEVTFLQEYAGRLYAGGHFTASCKGALDGLAWMCTKDECSSVSGNVYYDKNDNCTKQPNEKGLLRMVEILPGPYYATTDSNGTYNYSLPAGTYTISLVPFTYWEQTCPAPGTGHTVTIANPAESINGKDFASRPIPGIRDLRISVVGGPARPGFQTTYTITYTNAGTETMNGKVYFVHDAALTFVSSTPHHNGYTSPILEWNFANLEMGESRSIQVTFGVPSTLALGTNLCGFVDIDPRNNDLSLDNRDSFCIIVRGSYDPNDIRVAPIGIEENGEISRNDSVLTYTVRFQNTGTDTAFRVVVIDTLSTLLDVKSITLGAGSHPFVFSVKGNGILTWTFDNIMLPDSGANEQKSHGTFKYTVKQKPNLPVGSEIPNRVGIYFDFNAPVMTNTVINFITGASSVPTSPAADGSINAYPNPAGHMLYVSSPLLKEGTTVTVRNMLGQSVASYKHDGTGVMAIDAAALSAGAYLIAIETAEGTAVQRVTIVK